MPTPPGQAPEIGLDRVATVPYVPPVVEPAPGYGMPPRGGSVGAGLLRRNNAVVPGRAAIEGIFPAGDE